jgi:hypothetical protein
MGRYTEFLNYKPELFLIEWDIIHGQLLLEYRSASTLIDRTDKGRIHRADYEVMTTSPKAVGLEGDLRQLIFNFKASPSTENKRHHGWITYINKTQKITELYCSCKDYAFRLFKVYESKGMLNRSKIPNRYIKHASVIPKDEWPDVTNPKGKTYVCKHLAALIKNYFLDQKEPLPEPTNPESSRKPIIPKKPIVPKKPGTRNTIEYK